MIVFLIGEAFLRRPEAFVGRDFVLNLSIRHNSNILNIYIVPVNDKKYIFMEKNTQSN